jgi:hypothetical protein
VSKKERKPATSPERLVLALIENAHFEEALVLLDELESKQKSESEVKVQTNKTILLYAKALASFGAAGANPSEQALAKANTVLHQAFAANNFVLPLMVSRVNQVSNKTSKKSKQATKTVLPTAQHQADKYIDLWFGSWLHTENAFDWLGNQFVEWTKATKIERLKSQHENMLANSKKLDLDFFLN